MRAIQIERHGGPEVLGLAEIPVPAPGDGQVRVRVAAAGLNYIDTYHRRGLYPVELPFVPGLEGAGVVDAVGSGVHGFAVGDRVAWTSVPGSYTEYVVASPDRLVSVPDGIELEVAAAVMLQGLTAHYLTHDTYRLQPGDRCLVHAGAGGVGRLLIQMAVDAGATVYATAGNDEKRRIAREVGAILAVDYERFVEEVEAAAGRKTVDVVYDGVGQATYLRDFEVLRIRGMAVLFGQASGPVAPLDLQELNRHGSLYTTRPSLFHYIATTDEFRRRSSDVFAAIVDGRLDVFIGARFPLDDAAEAHRALEGRATVGKVLLIP